MNDDDAWIYLDGPEPERIRSILETLRDPLPLTPATAERMERAFLARLTAKLEREAAPAGAPVPPGGPPDGAPATLGRPAEPPAYVPGPRAALLVEQPREAEDRARTAPPAPAPPPAPVPPPLPALAGTLNIADMSALVAPVLPFVDASQVPAAPAPPEVAKTTQIPVMRGPGDTVGPGDDSISKIVAAIPFDGNTTGGGTVIYPSLTFEAYASLCAERRVHPDRLARIMTRYKVVSVPSLRALDADWQAYLDAQPDTRARFDHLVTQYADWLRLSGL